MESKMTLNYQKVWNTLNELELVTAKVCSARTILESAIDALAKGNKDKSESLMYATDEFLQYYLQDFDSKFKDAWNETVVKLKDQKTTADSIFGFDNVDFRYQLSNDWENHYYPEEATFNDQYSTPKNIQESFINYPENNTIFSWGKSDIEELRYTEEELNAMCDKASSDHEKEKCREYNLREAEYYDKKAKTGLISYYNDMIASGYEMTADGFWIKEDKVVKWRLPIEIDSISGDYYFTLPDDLLEKTGWKEDDPLYWVDNGDGSFTLVKYTEPLGMDEC